MLLNELGPSSEIVVSAPPAPVKSPTPSAPWPVNVTTPLLLIDGSIAVVSVPTLVVTVPGSAIVTALRRPPRKRCSL